VCSPYRHTQWPLFRFPWLGYPDPSGWLRLDRFMVAKTFHHDQTLCRFDRFHAVDASRSFALVILRHLAYREGTGSLGFHQQPLKVVSRFVIPTKGGLDRSAFAVGTRSVPASVRGCVPSPRLAFAPSLPFLSCDSWFYPPSDRADVSVSSSFPRSICFFGNPSLAWLAVGCLLSGSTARKSHARVTPFRSGVLRSSRSTSIRRVKGVKSSTASMLSTPM